MVGSSWSQNTQHGKGAYPTHMMMHIYIYFYIARNEKKQHFQQTKKRIPKPPQWCSSASHNHLDEISFCERVFFSHCSVAVFSHAFRVVLQCLGPLWPENTRLIYFGFHFCSWTSEVTPPSLFTCARRLSEEVWVGDMSISNYGQRLLMLEYVQVSACFKI